MSLTTPVDIIRKQWPGSVRMRTIEEILTEALNKNYLVQRAGAATMNISTGAATMNLSKPGGIKRPVILAMILAPLAALPWATFYILNLTADRIVSDQAERTSLAWANYIGSRLDRIEAAERESENLKLAIEQTQQWLEKSA